MAQSLFFYDLETSGISAAYSRVMQFGGLRTDLDLKPLGEPINWLVKLPDDVLPEPEATLVHGITPQKTLAEGMAERDFAQKLAKEIFLPDTIAVGFNNIRFDDEFIRHLLWRNFYDPYEWHWQAGRSRWDLMDLTRMTRALRPKGLNWPQDKEGNPTNRLVPLAEANGFAIASAHDAKEDILATVEWARRLKSAQPKLYDFSFSHRDKHSVAKIISSAKPLKTPFLYTSGAFPSQFSKTTAAIVLGSHPSDSNAVIVYDLRHNPKSFTALSAKDMSSLLYLTREQREEQAPLPVKKLSLNKAPAVAPLAVLDKAAQKRIGLNQKTIESNLKLLASTEGFYERVAEAYDMRDKPPARQDVEGQLYDGFLNDKDKAAASSVASAKPAELADLSPEFIDERLPQLFLRYKARNLPFTLSESEQAEWESWRVQKLLKGVDGSLSLPKFVERLAKTSEYAKTKEQQFLLEELKLYAESIAPPQLFDA
jgi:exodeoxyribonuclease-1